MSDELKVTYHDIEIVYDEYENKWVFELRGQERSSESLKLAKEMIDKPAPKSKKPFKRIKAWWKGRGEFIEVEITSVAEPNRYSSRKEVWISYKDEDTEQTERKKEDIDDIYADTPRNRERIAEFIKMSAHIDNVIEDRDAVVESMDGLELPEPEACAEGK